MANRIGRTKHVGICHKGCREAHDFCAIPNCGKVGKHLASDHVAFRWLPIAESLQNADYSITLPSND